MPTSRSATKVVASGRSTRSIYPEFRSSVLFGRNVIGLRWGRSNVDLIMRMNGGRSLIIRNLNFQ